MFFQQYSEPFDASIFNIVQNSDNSYRLTFTNTKVFFVNAPVVMVGDTLEKDEIIIKDGSIKRIKTYLSIKEFNNLQKQNNRNKWIKKYSGSVINLNNKVRNDCLYQVVSEYILPKNISIIDCSGVASNVTLTIFDQPHHNCTYINASKIDNVEIHFDKLNGRDIIEQPRNFSVKVAYSVSEILLYGEFQRFDSTKNAFPYSFALFSKNDPRQARILLKSCEISDFSFSKRMGNTRFSFQEGWLHTLVEKSNTYPIQRYDDFHSDVISREKFAYALNIGDIPQDVYDYYSTDKEFGCGNLAQDKCQYQRTKLHQYFAPRFDENIIDNIKLMHKNCFFTVQIKNKENTNKVKLAVMTKEYGMVNAAHYYSQREDWFNIYEKNIMQQVVVIPASDYYNMYIVDERLPEEKEINNPEIAVFIHDSFMNNPVSTDWCVEKVDSKSKKTHEELVFVPTYANDIFDGGNNKNGFCDKTSSHFLSTKFKK